MHDGSQRKSRITEVSGVGQSTAADLAEHGIRSIRELAAASVGKLTAIRGFGSARAASVRQAAAGLLSAAKAEQTVASDGKNDRKAGRRQRGEGKTRKKKDKKKKKKKKKDKKKARKVKEKKRQRSGKKKGKKQSIKKGQKKIRKKGRKAKK